jgi:hypothetical protein
MVDYCANPICHKPLHYLREGKVFLFSRKNMPDDASRLPYRLEHFWLCGICVKKWTLIADWKDGNKEIRLVETKRKRFPANFEMLPVRAS